MGSQVSFPGGKGPRLSDLMRDKLDSAYEAYMVYIQKKEKSLGKKMVRDIDFTDSRLYGRIEGCAAQLGILRSTSTKHEIEEAKERYERTNH